MGSTAHLRLLSADLFRLMHANEDRFGSLADFMGPGSCSPLFLFTAASVGCSGGLRGKRGDGLSCFTAGQSYALGFASQL